MAGGCQGNLRVGDAVSTPDGGSASIIGVFPRGTIPISRVRFVDGRVVEACGEHVSFWRFLVVRAPLTLLNLLVYWWIL